MDARKLLAVFLFEDVSMSAETAGTENTAELVFPRIATPVSRSEQRATSA
jgi:hypothetical protein